MSKQSRQFQVPDALANLYDFANTLDVRHFTHHGVRHRKDDELKRPDDLAAWMAQRKLSRSGAKVTPADLFQIGSITKSFTSVAILHLATAAKLTVVFVGRMTEKGR